jgi:hypothetical protein
MPLSGPDWVAKFPSSASLNDLVEPFKTNATRFVAALKAAHATVSIAATFRPPERAYLMHFSFVIANGTVDPATVPAMAGVDIQWVHPTLAASKAAAAQMVAAYGIQFPPVLQSRHTERKAVDMDVTWQNNLVVAKADGSTVTIVSTPREGAFNTDLHKVGATYGVIKLVTDHPHWSLDGH